jgi:thiosulfate/3-mercaptopyruvate sulfurtransferase
MPSAHPRAELLATPDWLAANLARHDLRVLDVRWRPDGSARLLWAAGHLPGAVYLDWANDLVGGTDDAGVLRLAAPDLVTEAIAAAGVSDNHEVVVYDDAASLFAARVWWSLRVAGHARVRILDGGLAGWTGAGHPLSADPVPVERAHFTGRDEAPERVTWSDVRALLRAPDVTFVDARPPVLYRNNGAGSGRGLDHLSRAVVVPAAATTHPGSGRFRSADELRALFGKTRIERGRRLVCYDTSGIGAAKVAFVASLLGHDQVAVYDGGWAEWGERADGPEAVLSRRSP